MVAWESGRIPAPDQLSGIYSAGDELYLPLSTREELARRA